MPGEISEASGATGEFKSVESASAMVEAGGMADTDLLSVIEYLPSGTLPCLQLWVG